LKNPVRSHSNARGQIGEGYIKLGGVTTGAQRSGMSEQAQTDVLHYDEKMLSFERRTVTADKSEGKTFFIPPGSFVEQNNESLDIYVFGGQGVGTENQNRFSESTQHNITRKSSINAFNRKGLFANFAAGAIDDDNTIMVLGGYAKPRFGETEYNRGTIPWNWMRILQGGQTRAVQIKLNYVQQTLGCTEMFKGGKTFFVTQGKLHLIDHHHHMLLVGGTVASSEIEPVNSTALYEFKLKKSTEMTFGTTQANEMYEMTIWNLPGQGFHQGSSYVYNTETERFCIFTKGEGDFNDQSLEVYELEFKQDGDPLQPRLHQLSLVTSSSGLSMVSAAEEKRCVLNAAAIYVVALDEYHMIGGNSGDPRIKAADHFVSVGSYNPPPVSALTSKDKELQRKKAKLLALREEARRERAEKLAKLAEETNKKKKKKTKVATATATATAAAAAAAAAATATATATATAATPPTAMVATPATAAELPIPKTVNKLKEELTKRKISWSGKKKKIDLEGMIRASNQRMTKAHNILNGSGVPAPGTMITWKKHVGTLEETSCTCNKGSVIFHEVMQGHDGKPKQYFVLAKSEGLDGMAKESNNLKVQEVVNGNIHDIMNGDVLTTDVVQPDVLVTLDVVADEIVLEVVAEKVVAEKVVHVAEKVVHVAEEVVVEEEEEVVEEEASGKKRKRKTPSAAASKKKPPTPKKVRAKRRRTTSPTLPFTRPYEEADGFTMWKYYKKASTTNEAVYYKAGKQRDRNKDIYIYLNIQEPHPMNIKKAQFPIGISKRTLKIYRELKTSESE